MCIYRRFTQFYVIIEVLVFLLVVPVFRHRIRHHPRQFTVIVADVPFGTANGGSGTLIELPVAPDEKYNVFFGAEKIANDLIDPFYDLKNRSISRCPKNETV